MLEGTASPGVEFSFVFVLGYLGSTKASGESAYLLDMEGVAGIDYMGRRIRICLSCLSDLRIDLFTLVRI